MVAYLNTNDGEVLKTRKNNANWWADYAPVMPGLELSAYAAQLPPGHLQPPRRWTASSTAASGFWLPI